MYPYDRARGIPEQIDAFKGRVRELADMNRHYKICAMYHVHSGLGLFGASVWDLWLLLRDFDSEYVGVNYDIGHATVEGGYGGWRDGFRLTAPYVHGIAIKDFKWGQDAKGQWVPQWSALGEGMVNFREFLPAEVRCFFRAGAIAFRIPWAESKSARLRSRFPRKTRSSHAA